jgi:hypothetical protein
MKEKELSLKATQMYEFDFDKIKTMVDVIDVLKGLQISFSENFVGIEEVRHLIKEKNVEKPIWVSTSTTDKEIKWDL